MQPDQPTPARCPARYEREGGRLPEDRLVHCHLEAGHPGEHEEADTEVTWLNDALDDHERFRDQVLADPARRDAYIQARVDAAYQRGLAEGSDGDGTAAYATGRADGRRATAHDLERLRAEVERLQALLDHAEQYARDLQDNGGLPESVIGDGPCQDCGAPNIRWFADSGLWNRVVGGPDARDDPGGIFCIHCFVKRADATGCNPSAWHLALVPRSGGSDA